MEGVSRGPAGHPRAPLHLWLIAPLLVVWNGIGLAIAIGAQTARVVPPDPDIVTYFQNQPTWFVVLADLGPLAGMVAALALLVQSRWATRLFAAQFTIIFLANTYEVLIGTSLLLTSAQTRSASVALAIMIAAEFLYAGYVRRKGVLY